MDFITDFPFSIKLRVRILLMITDRLNKGIILIPMLLISAPAVAHGLYGAVYSVPRVPEGDY